MAIAYTAVMKCVNASICDEVADVKRYCLMLSLLCRSQNAINRMSNKMITKLVISAGLFDKELIRMRRRSLDGVMKLGFPGNTFGN